MRRFLLPAFLLLAANAQAQSLDSSMPTPIMGAGQAGAVQGMNDGYSDGAMSDGPTRADKRQVLNAAIREAIARDKIAKDAKEQAAAEAKAKGKKTAAAPLLIAPAAQAPQPVPVRKRANAEDEILQELQ